MKRSRLFSAALAVSLLVTLMPIGPPAAVAVPTLATTETRLTTNAADQFDPAISGNTVVYTDMRGADADVWYCDLAAKQEVQVTNAPGHQQLTDVSGDTIVYSDYVGYDVWAYSIAGATATNLTGPLWDSMSIDPAVGQGLVAWQDSRDGNREIYAKDLATGEERRISDSPLIDERSAVDRGTIVWQEGIGGVLDIRAYDWATGITRQITNTPTDDERSPDVSGNRVVYAGLRDGERDVYCYDLTTGIETRLSLSGDQVNPNVSGDWVSFDDYSTGFYHVRLWHVPSNAVYDLATTALPVPWGGVSQQYLNDIEATGPNTGRVVYTDDRNGLLDIYMTEFELKFPHADVSPAEVQFGTVEVGKSAPAIVTIQNTGASPLTVTGATLDPAPSGVSITSAPTLPAVVVPGGYIEVNLAFAPTAAGAVSGALKIETDDPANQSISVPIFGTGAKTESPPEQLIVELLAFYRTSLGSGSLYGVGPGKSAGNRAKALDNMIEATGDLIRQGRTADAIQQLRDIYKKCDGEAQPPDFIDGAARAELATRVLKLITALGGTP